jgi:hypothetical protein
MAMRGKNPIINPVPAGANRAADQGRFGGKTIGGRKMVKMMLAMNPLML